MQVRHWTLFPHFTNWFRKHRCNQGISHSSHNVYSCPQSAGSVAKGSKQRKESVWGVFGSLTLWLLYDAWKKCCTWREGRTNVPRDALVQMDSKQGCVYRRYFFFCWVLFLFPFHWVIHSSPICKVISIWICCIAFLSAVSISPGFIAVIKGRQTLWTLTKTLALWNRQVVPAGPVTRRQFMKVCCAPFGLFIYLSFIFINVPFRALWGSERSPPPVSKFRGGISWIIWSWGQITGAAFFLKPCFCVSQLLCFTGMWLPILG